MRNSIHGIKASILSISMAPALLLSQIASAEPQVAAPAFSAAVSTDDLNLAKPGDQEILLKRIKLASKHVCRFEGSPGVNPWGRSECESRTYAATIDKLMERLASIAPSAAASLAARQGSK